MAQILFITGPSGAGKTTTCKEFLKSAEGEWAYINQDEIRQFVVAGYQSAGDYRYNWNEGTKRQWAVSIPICADLANRYTEYGINCVVDFFAPPEEFELWKPFLKGLEYKLLVLLPDEETTVQRNAGREGRSRLKDNKVRENHGLFEAWKQHGVPVIDTSQLGLPTVLSKINQLIH